MIKYIILIVILVIQSIFNEEHQYERLFPSMYIYFKTFILFPFNHIYYLTFHSSINLLPLSIQNLYDSLFLFKLFARIECKKLL